MVYVALLRGINVGGKARVEMIRLKAVIESLGCSDVQTYINSGNVLFSDNRPEIQLQHKIFAAITAEFGFEVPVQLRSQKQMQNLVLAIPKNWKNDSELKTDILFMDETLSIDAAQPYIKVNPNIDERTITTEHEIIWSVARKDITKGRLAKIVGTDVYRHITIRNVNTVLKLHALMEASSAKR